uniref:F-box domain-containing protein n=1 Tax=Setaria digitata TaxID=48799 RepID=A0A915PSF8_9BILA
MACSDEALSTSLDNISDNILIKIFRFIAEEKNSNPNVSVHNMYRLKLVCRRFNDLLEKNIKELPRYHVNGIRIRSKKVGLLGYFVAVYRYGTGAFEPPCACLDLIDVPSFLRHDIIHGFIFVDRMELTDRLFITLHELTYAEDVAAKSFQIQKIVFSKIDSINLSSHRGICAFLDRFPCLMDLSFFGYYGEHELDLRQSQVVAQMMISGQGSGIFTRKDMKNMVKRLKYRKNKKSNRCENKVRGIHFQGKST